MTEVGGIEWWLRGNRPHENQNCPCVFVRVTVALLSQIKILELLYELIELPTEISKVLSCMPFVRLNFSKNRNSSSGLV